MKKRVLSLTIETIEVCRDVSNAFYSVLRANGRYLFTGFFDQEVSPVVIPRRRLLGRSPRVGCTAVGDQHGTVSVCSDLPPVGSVWLLSEFRRQLPNEAAEHRSHRCRRSRLG